MSAAGGEQVSQVLGCLAQVSDPELDESVTDLGFVTGVSVTGDGDVQIGFRLPTYWCAANFAFLMADDMRRAVQALPWAREVKVVLDEHMNAETINAAMVHRQSFQEAFAAEADGNLDDLRRVFELKAFQRRQMVLLDHLLAAGHLPQALLALSIADLQALPGAEPALVARYLQRRGLPGRDAPGDPAFVDEDGRPVPLAGYPAHRRALRRVAVSVEFNGALCRGLLAARYNEPEGEPTLLDFVRQAPNSAQAGATQTTACNGPAG